MEFNFSVSLSERVNCNKCSLVFIDANSRSLAFTSLRICLLLWKDKLLTWPGLFYRSQADQIRYTGDQRRPAEPVYQSPSQGLLLPDCLWHYCEFTYSLTLMLWCAKILLLVPKVVLAPHLSDVTTFLTLLSAPNSLVFLDLSSLAYISFLFFLGQAVSQWGECV